MFRGGALHRRPGRVHVSSHMRRFPRVHRRRPGPRRMIVNRTIINRGLRRRMLPRQRMTQLVKMRRNRLNLQRAQRVRRALNHLQRRFRPVHFRGPVTRLHRHLLHTRRHPSQR